MAEDLADHASRDRNGTSAPARAEVVESDLEAFARWFDTAYPRLSERAAVEIPDAPSADADRVAQRVIAQACAQYELAFVPSRFHHAGHVRRNEILALLVLKLARVYGKRFESAEDAREETLRLLEQTTDEDKVRAAVGSAGAFLAPLLSPQFAKRAWKIFVRVPFWAKLTVAGGLVTLLLAAPMVKPLSLGLLARNEFRVGTMISAYA